MSAFAVPGHHGVLVLSIAPHSRRYADGLRANTAILTLNSRLPDGTAHLRPGNEII